MENERREEPQPEPVSSTPESPAYQERERRDDPPEARSDYSESAEPATFSAEGNISSNDSESGPVTDQPQPASNESGPPPQDRGGRGRRGRRLPPRDRNRGRGRDRDRRGGGGSGGGRERERDHRPGFSGQHHGGGQSYQQHSGGAPRETQPESARHEGPPQSGGSLLSEARAEVERIREVLEGILRDLEDVSEQLSKAEHEKDIAEGEIEQLRDSLRRLHR